MNWFAVVLFPVIFFLCSIVWVIGAAFGVGATYVAARLGAFHYDPAGGDVYHRKGCWRYSWPWMRFFSTWDNGACPRWAREDWYADLPLWRALWKFSGLRNAFGGNPFNLYDVPPEKIRWVGTTAHATAGALETGKFAWNITQYRYAVGFHMVWPWSDATRLRVERAVNSVRRLFRKPGITVGKHAHFEVRHGWKLYPDRTTTAVFSVWDTGPRLK